jgi:glycerol-3-phosphate dehydrogenase
MLGNEKSMMNQQVKGLDREQTLIGLRQDKLYDVVIVGAGATGLGLAVDAASRGLSTVIVDSQDFGAGTSSRSTKLIHGGIRYMRNPKEWGLVRQAMAERAVLMRNAPELVKPLPFVVPCYSALQMAMYTTGVASYCSMGAGGPLAGMKVRDRIDTLATLPGIRRQGLKGSVQYFDAQFDDARMAVALLHTALKYGALALNYAPVTRVVQDDRGIQAVVVKDKETSEELTIRGKVFFNCTGPWTDTIRRLADPCCDDLVRISRGSHIVVDGSFMPSGSAMVIPKTSDGRILFCIPSNGMLQIGTTDIEQGQAPFDPEATSDEIDFMIETANRYLQRPIERKDVKATYTGLRPLFNFKGLGRRSGTAGSSRDFAVVSEFGNLISVAGGKWTSYRLMAQEAMKQALKLRLIESTKGGSLTASLPLLVDTTHNPAQLEQEVVKAASVQDVVDRVCEYARYAVRVSGARTAQDVLFRRLRIGQMSEARAEELMPYVEEVVRQTRA